MGCTFSKFKERSAKIGASEAPVSIATYAYNVPTVAVISYVAQLIPLPPNAPQTERTAMQSILHIATNALSHSAYFHLRQAGGPQRITMCAVGAATIFRTAVQTLRQWPEWKKQLILAAQTSLPMVRWSQDLFYPDFWDWDSQAIAFNLDRTYRCFPGDRWAAGARSTFDEITKAEITSKPQIQGLAYTNLVECSFANDLESIVSTRLIKMFGLA